MATDGYVRTALTLIATIAVLTVLYLAPAVFAPLACALFIIAIVWPLQDRLQTFLPRLIALVIVVAVCVGVFVALASLGAWGFGRVGRVLVNGAGRFQLIYEQASVWLESHGIAVAGVWTDYFSVQWLLRVIQDAGVRAKTTLSFWLIVLVYVALGLLEVRETEAKLRGVRNAAISNVLVVGSALTAAKIRKYMLVRTLMSALTGLLVWLIASVAGLPLAAEWGIIAFTLNYIPVIGPFIATLLPAIFALAQFDSWQTAATLVVCLSIVQFVVGSYVEPRVAGTALAISPFIVLFSVLFWTFMWGLFGAFIGIPITIAVLTLCAQDSSTRWVSEVFGVNRSVEE